MNIDLSQIINGMVNKPISRDVVVVEHWYDYHQPFKIIVNGECLFWANTKEMAEELAQCVRENRLPDWFKFE